jgi:hypothetical protein
LRSFRRTSQKDRLGSASDLDPAGLNVRNLSSDAKSRHSAVGRFADLAAASPKPTFALRREPIRSGPYEEFKQPRQNAEVLMFPIMRR